MPWSPEQSLPTLWGKSQAGAGPVPLLQHLLDSAAVAERLWDDVLADAVRDPLDELMDGRGRQLFSLLAGWHDLGKATPGFQAKVPELAVTVDRTGLRTRPESRAERWRHELGSGAIVREVLAPHWPKEHIDWFWPLLAGHHGRVPRVGALRPQPVWLRGDEQWKAVQHALAQRVVDELGFAPPVPRRAPSRSRQLVLAGHVVMADWIASDESRFTAADTASPSIAGARERAGGALATLGLRRGIRPAAAGDAARLSVQRFGVQPRPLQQLVVHVARTGPGLMIVEAPMGEGKTEAALLAVEVLARRTGQDGVFVALPTQATSDPMFSRVRRWVATFDDPPDVGLLHGKRAVNPEWRAARSRTSYAAVDEFGMTDAYSRTQPHSAVDPVEWFLGSKRGLLQPVAVGTVDQVLHAATRTKHVMLRHAGLASGVVVVDEVHAYDAYMSQFLHEALRWAAAAAIPVLLLSATLPPASRRELVEAYAEGAAADAPVPGVAPSPGYPAVLSLSGGAPEASWSTTQAYRPSRPVTVSVLPQEPDEDAAALVALLEQRLTGGGIALVIRNTVGRAQQTYAALKQVFGSDVRLLHARLTTGARADRADELVRLLGPSTDARPRRLVVVATQVAEQSFDIDADLLVTDLAPIDLLLQRSGRLHRHDRPSSDRPPGLRTPEVMVTGVRLDDDGPPHLPGGSLAVYGELLLLRAAHLVQQASGSTWDLPAQVPALVADGYTEDDDGLADSWQDRLGAARIEQVERTASRRANAKAFLLAKPGDLHRPTLASLHDLDVADVGEDAVRAVVRDGEESVEVTLVVRHGPGYETLAGRSLGTTGEAVLTEPDLLDEVVGSTVRLPASPGTRSLNAAARDELRPLPGWTSEPYLRKAATLELDRSGEANLAGWQLRYDDELGLLHGRGGSHR